MITKTGLGYNYLLKLSNITDINIKWLIELVAYFQYESNRYVKSSQPVASISHWAIIFIQLDSLFGNIQYSFISPS